jgi:aconitate hydratase
MESANPFSQVKQDIEVEGHKYSIYSLPALGDERVKTLPYSIRVLLESAVRNCDEFNVKSKFAY